MAVANGKYSINFFEIPMFLRCGSPNLSIQFQVKFQVQCYVKIRLEIVKFILI
jgi:hypothetical protein